MLFNADVIRNLRAIQIVRIIDRDLVEFVIEICHIYFAQQCAIYEPPGVGFKEGCRILCCQITAFGFINKTKCRRTLIAQIVTFGFPLCRGFGFDLRFYPGRFVGIECFKIGKQGF